VLSFLSLVTVGFALSSWLTFLQKRYKEAEELLVDAADRIRKSLSAYPMMGGCRTLPGLIPLLPGNDHEVLGLVLNNLGFLLKERKQFDRAERCYLEALRIRTRFGCLAFSVGYWSDMNAVGSSAVGPKHVDTVSTQHNLAELYLALNQTEKCDVNC
jgi:tetratricopeptide (TPR) repeat protein